jgi:hypothetical protein
VKGSQLRYNVNLHSRSVTLQPRQVILFNDIAATFWNQSRKGLTVQVNSFPERPYGYEVRNDTGEEGFPPVSRASINATAQFPVCA